MRFLTRGLMGLAILGLTLGLLALGAGRMMTSMREAAETRPARPPAERVVAVGVGVIERGLAHPVITAYGRLESRRTLDLRAGVTGPVSALSPDFRDGAAVEAGTLLVEIDPADAASARDMAAATLSETQAELAEAEAAVALARDDVAAAREQRDLRAAALERQEELQGRRVTTDATVEAARLALSAAEQALIGRRQALAQAEARITRARLARDRARLTLADAERVLADTRILAPFDGLIADATAVLGRRVTVNEPLGRLIDPAAVEVAFRVSNAEFARLIDAAGRLRPAPVTAVLDLGGRSVTATGRLARADAEVGEGQTGRLLYAALELDPATVLRPGDFLTVAISEPPMEDVAVLPATAVTEDGRLLILNDEDRLEEIMLPILRRQGNTVILGQAPEGARYVTTRLPTLGAGLKVRPVAPEAMADRAELISLTPARRAALIAAVEANARLPEDERARLLARLREDRVPRSMLERLESDG